MTAEPKSSFVGSLYKRVHEAPTPRARFTRHLALHTGFGSVLVAGSLLAGTSGFHWLAGQPWDDAFVNTAMLLGGMGPTGRPEPGAYPLAGKLFAAAFALYAGLVFLILASLLVGPLFQHALRRFDAEREAVKRKAKKTAG